MANPSPRSLWPPGSLQPQADVEMPGSVGVDLCLGISELAVVYLLRPACHTAGLRFDTFTLQSKGKSNPSHSEMDRDEPDLHVSSRSLSSFSGGVLRLDVEFADGRRISSREGDKRAEGGHITSRQGGRRTHDIVLFKLSSRSGCSDEYRDGLDQWYLSPLAESGDLVFVCEWPALNIAETRTTLNGDAVRKAAKRARRLWG
jgi:hypothetical protein